MNISRTILFLVFVLLLAVPLFTGKILWLYGSKRTVGVFSFQESGNALEQFRSSNSVCYYIKGNDTIWFRAPGNLKLKEGDPIPVRYQPTDSSDARVFSFRGFWRGTLLSGGLVFIVILVAFLNKGVFPRGSKIELFNKKVLICIT